MPPRKFSLDHIEALGKADANWRMLRGRGLAAASEYAVRTSSHDLSDGILAALVFGKSVEARPTQEPKFLL